MYQSKETMNDAASLCWRADEAKKRRDLWRSLLQDAYALASPYRNPYLNDSRSRKNSAPPMNELFESTMLVSNHNATNKLLLDIAPPEQRWPTIKVGPALENRLKKFGDEGKAMKDALVFQIEGINDMLDVVFGQETFANALWEVLHDVRTAGMGVLLHLDQPQNDIEPVLFQCIPQDEVAVEDGPDGREIGIYRCREIRVSHIKRLWVDATVPKEMLELAKGKDKDPEVSLSECTYKEGDAWKYRVMWKQKGSDPADIVTRDYATPPFTVFHWSKIPGCEYGPGPVIIMLPDGRTINKVMEYVLKNAALALAGMYMVRDDGVVNPDNIQIMAGGLIPVASTGGAMGASIQPLATSREFNVGQIILDDLRMIIRKGLGDNALPDPAGGARSPTEIIERIREFTQLNGGASGRMVSAMSRVVRAVVDILGQRGLIPPVKIDNFALRVQINSPLARAQQFAEVETVVRWIELCNGIGGEELTALVAELEEILVWMAEAIGVPITLVRPAKARAAIKKQQAEAASLQNSIAMVAQAAPALQAAGSMMQQAA
jgi:hypothetical protein